MTEVTRQIGVMGAVATWQAQFEDLVARQARFVFRVAYAVLRNTGDSEDVVQETFLRVFRRGRFDVDDERAFLARIAWRLAVDTRARGHREAVAGHPVVACVEAEVMAADRIAAVHRLIDSLPEELRQPLALSTVDELTSGEIGKILGIAEGTVRTRLMRARQLLKQKVEAGGMR
jgi:RNA polymerase sigma-70 factor (ECF subfamily)